MDRAKLNSALFEELDYQQTPLGALILRRRRIEEIDVFEVKLGDEFLMSSQFTRGEEELARLGSIEAPGERLDVLVGGLGLGYTACAALANPHVGALVVIEKFTPVIEWCRAGLIPNGAVLGADPRVALVKEDFFAWAARPRAPGDAIAGLQRFHAVLLDIDHSPTALLDERNGAFYQAAGLRSFTDWLHPAGVFALWSNEAPSQHFMAILHEVFEQPQAKIIDFPNPLTGQTSSNTIYLARKVAS